MPCKTAVGFRSIHMDTRISKSSVTFERPEEMVAWGKSFAKTLRPGDVVAMIGGLGAGKTTLVRSIAEAWGFRDGASSPTFALANEYPTRRGTIYHMDMYRLNKKELAAFPLEDYWGTGLCLIEWADRIEDRLPASRIDLNIKIAGPMTRILRLKKRKGRHGR